MDVLGYLPKLKTVRDSLFMLIFCMIYHKKCSLFNFLSIGRVSVSYLFSFSRYYQTKCVKLSSYLASWWHHFIICLWTSAKTIANREKEEGKTNIEKIEYFEREKSFQDKIKKHFSQLFKAYHLVGKWKTIFKETIKFFQYN